MDINKKGYWFAMNLQYPPLNIEIEIAVVAPPKLTFKYTVGIIPTA